MTRQDFPFKRKLYFHIRSTTWRNKIIVTQFSNTRVTTATASIGLWLQPNAISISAATWQNQQNECAPIEDSDQPGHRPSLIRVFAVRMKTAWVLSCPLNAQRRLWSDWAEAQADLSLRWAHTHFVDFVMSRLILWCLTNDTRIRMS